MAQGWIYDEPQPTRVPVAKVDELLAHDPLLEEFEKLEREVKERDALLRQSQCDHGIPDGIGGLVSCSACGYGEPLE